MPSFPLAPPPPTPAPGISGVPAAGRFISTTKQFLGFGLTRPFRRDKKSDFATGGGVEDIQSCVGQILGTRCSAGDVQGGELPWRTDFGSRLHQLRHRNNDAILSELARVYVVEALQRWEPRVRIKAVAVTRESSENGENVLAVRLRYDIITANVDGNQVVVRDVSQEVSF